MKSIILGAGEGKRLRPYTDDRPKCLVDLCGRSLLERGLDVHSALGIHDVVVVGGYRSEMLGGLGVRTVYNPQYASSNMVASLMCAADHLDGRSDVLVIYADILYEARVLRALIEAPGTVALAVNTDWETLWRARMPDPLADAETMVIDAHGHVLSLGKKPTSYAQVQGQYMGMIKFSAAAAGRIREVHGRLDPKGTYDGQPLANMYMTSFLQHWIDHVSPIHAVRVHGGWLEVDSTEDLAVYEQLQRAGRLENYCRLEPPVSPVRLCASGALGAIKRRL